MSNEEGLTKIMSKFATAYGQSASRPRLHFKFKTEKMNLKDGRWRESILLLLAFIGTGIQLSVTGPVLPDLAHRTGNTLSEYGILFLTRAIGYILGAFVAIPVVDKIEIMFLMMIVGLGNTAACVSLVFCDTLAKVSAVLSFDGFTMGFLDTAGKCQKL